MIPAGGEGMGTGSPARGGRRCRTPGVVGWLAAIVVAIAVAVGAPAGTRAEGGASVAAPQLNLRAEPGMWAPVVGQLWQGERLALLAGPTPDDWYQVQAGDQTGWAYGGLLALDGAGDAFGQETLGATGGAERWVDVNRTHADGDAVRGRCRGRGVLGGDGERPVGRRLLRDRCRHVLRL